MRSWYPVRPSVRPHVSGHNGIIYIIFLGALRCAFVCLCPFSPKCEITSDGNDQSLRNMKRSSDHVRERVDASPDRHRGTHDG
jgi:hypothetical protein